MKIIVTGVSGFLGRSLAQQLLNHGHDVIGVSRSQPSTSLSGKFTHAQGDLRDENFVNAVCEGAQTVFHTAAKVGAWGNYDEFYATNVVGTRNLIRASKKHQVKKFVYTSTPSVVFGKESICNGNESLPYAAKFSSPYQATKAQAEKMVLDANDASITTCALRPHAIWGIGDQHLVPRIVELAKSGKLRVIGDGTNKLSMTHIDNAVAAHIQASLSDNVGGKAYFVNDPEPVELWTWIGNVLNTIGHDAPSRHISFSTAYALATGLEYAYRYLPLPGEPRITRYMVSLLAQSHYFDISNAQKDFGYTPAIDADTAFKALAASYQNDTERSENIGNAVPSET